MEEQKRQLDEIFENKYVNLSIWGVFFLLYFIFLSNKFYFMVTNHDWHYLKTWQFYINLFLFILSCYYLFNIYVWHFGLYPKAIQAYESGDVLKALKHFKLLAKIYPRNAHVIASIGNCYYRLEDWKKAIEYYTRALKFEPHSVYIYENRSNAYKFLGYYIHYKKDLNKVKQLKKEKTKK